LGRIAMAEGDLALAQAHLEKTIEIGAALEEQEFAVLPRLGLAEIALARRNRHAALRLARIALASGQRARTPWQVGRCHLLLGRLARTRAAAGRSWREAEAIFHRIGARYDLHHAWLLLLAAGDVPSRARRSMLRRLLAGVARDEHDALLREIEPEAGASVLSEALRCDVEVEYASTLLAGLGSRAVPHLRALLEDPRQGTRAVELLALIGGDEARAAVARAAGRTDEVGRAAQGELSDAAAVPPSPLRIRTLGSFEVISGSRRLTHADWKSARALRLFLLLLHHRFRWVPRETLIESLWPEAEPEKGSNNLRQSIHLLRGALEPDLRGNQTSRYIRARHEACRLDPGEGHEYDVEPLESALQQAERLWSATPRGRARPALREALALYPGDFLAEYPYEEFAATEREYLRDRVLIAMERLLELLAESQSWAEVEILSRQALALDSYRESHHRCLVLAQLRLGHRREALAACDEYERTMVREMGLPPSARMQALTEEVLALGASPRRR
jgi:DNA-binding SARP family transcriptional activator